MAHCQECGLDLAHIRDAGGSSPGLAAGGDVLAPPADGGRVGEPESSAPGEAAKVRTTGLPPWLDSVALPGEGGMPRGPAVSDADELGDEDLHPPRTEWSADAIPIEPIVGVPYRARERAEQPPTSEQAAAAALFAAAAAEEAQASPQAVSEPAEPRQLAPRLRRLAALALLLAVVVPLVWPMAPFGGPGAAPEPVVAAVKRIGELPAEATVLVAFDYDAGMAGELQPIAEAYLHQLLSQGARVLAVSTQPEGGALAQMTLDRVLPDHAGARYGETVLNLGYVPGGAVAVRALATNLPGAVRTDYRWGLPVRDFALLSEVAGARELSLIVVLGRDPIAVQRWIEQVATPYATPLVAGVPALAEPAISPYRTAGQLQGVVAGLGGAAAYERLAGRQGIAGPMLGAVRCGTWAAGGLVVLLNLVA